MRNQILVLKFFQIRSYGEALNNYMILISNDGNLVDVNFELEEQRRS